MRSKKKRPTVEVIRDRFADAFRSSLRRVLDVMRIRGWQFPASFAMGTRVLSDSPLATMLRIRMDDVSRVVRVRLGRLRGDLADASDVIVAEWLAKHATGRPVPPRMRGPISAEG